MLHRHYGRSALAGTLTLALMACGGGGNERPSDVEDLTDLTGPGENTFPVSATGARALIGAAEPDFADDDVAVTLDERLEVADSLLTGGLRATLANGTVVPITTVCAGETCRAPAASTLFGFELALSVSDLGYADTDGSGNARYEAVASHRGVSVAHGRGLTTFAGISVERYGYGGWMDHGFFVVESGEVTDGPTLIEGAELMYGYSVGTSSGSNPTATGGATWSGVMVGMDASDEGDPVQGDARITIDDFSDPMVDVEFDNVHNLVDGTRYNDMSWADMAPVDGRFQGGTGMRTIQGQFYGPGHEEVGGTFTHDSILGAFGAGR